MRSTLPLPYINPSLIPFNCIPSHRAKVRKGMKDVCHGDMVDEALQKVREVDADRKGTFGS